jgi:hypothetical protein
MLRSLILASVLTLQAQPTLLFTEADRDRINALAQDQPWAAGLRDAIIQAANNWPQSHLTRFGLKQLEVPAEGGQWWHHYVCPTQGVRLEFRPPSTHRCPVDGKVVTGWPYDQVILSDRHDALAAAARDLGLAWQLTRRPEYAEKAAWILNEYAAKYETYKLHDTNNRITRPAARAFAQTLDESIWLIDIAWAYDLIRDSESLDTQQRADIETKLLRASAATIRAYDAGASNWQSWHNAALAAVGFTLPDQDLRDFALASFRAQMQRSVLDGGFWYEGAWGYHFYALDALTRTAEMATRNGIDLWSEEPNLLALFRTPSLLMFADGSLPMFNDTAGLNIFSQDGLYEYAFQRTQDPALMAVLGRRSRSRHALLFGAAALPAAGKSPLASHLFKDAGYAVLRSPLNDHAVIMKFGPHGGGHGHNDKLGIVSYAFGGPLAVDPGTQSYTAPTHNTWDKTTIAHNTISVDEAMQREATGELLWFQQGDGFTAVAASAGAVYSQATLKRTLVTTAEYTLDLSEAAATDGQEHVFDWAYHNAGNPQSDLALEPWTSFRQTNGYQHLTNNRAAETAGPWSLTFDGTPAVPIPYGVSWNSTATVSARFEVSTEQAATGRVSARASYAFNGPGYMLYSTPTLANVPAGIPSALRAQVFGDASNHRLTLRLIDSTGETFVVNTGSVNWSGWREVTVRDPESWSHFGGNNDGRFDGPVRGITIAIDQTAGGPPSGAWYFDDLTLLYENESHLAAGFEDAFRSLRVSMLPAEGTTVVTGQGLGPDLRVPVHYVLARRKAQRARFAALLEPFQGEPSVTSFEEPEPGVFVVKTPGYTDRIALHDDGVAYTRRPAAPE